MGWSLALFLTTSVVFGVIFFMVVAFMFHNQKMKRLDTENLKVRKANIQEEVEKAVEKQLADHRKRIEVLEAIVTDKNYDLSEKITRLK